MRTAKVVSVIGGAGHVGLPLCLVLAKAGHHVYGIDINETHNRLIMDGKLPFIEEEGREYLKNALENQKLFMTSDNSKIEESDIVIIVIGTPIDENMNPRISMLAQMVKESSRFFKKGQLIILRSTVFPGTTKLVRQLIERNTSYLVGEDIFLAYAPERVAEGRAIKELQMLPQLIGTFNGESYESAEEFFSTFLQDKCLGMTPIEAELGKLISNMTRYVNFALANEFYLIAESFGANIHTIIDACNYHYPRLNLPSPGPNVGGPCLYKDGWFLLERIPFNEMISTAFRINEGMPMQIVSKLEQLPQIKKVTILGMTFKAGSDDTRNSLSFKLKKQLERNDYELVLVDPLLEDYKDMEGVQGSDAVVLMTPHKEFSDLESIMDLVAHDECLYVDMWGLWEKMKYRSRNGYFFGKEARLGYPGVRQ